MNHAQFREYLQGLSRFYLELNRRDISNLINSIIDDYNNKLPDVAAEVEKVCNYNKTLAEAGKECFDQGVSHMASRVLKKLKELSK
jgi:hypothetical protein